MHELGLTQSIVAIVAEHAAGRKVTRVTLEIGRLSAVMPDAIRFCFDIVAEGTALEGATLHIIEPEARARCSDCGVEVVLSTVARRCGCGSQRLQIIAGEQFRIKSMDLQCMDGDDRQTAIAATFLGRRE